MTERKPGMRLSALDILGIVAAHAAAGMGEDTGMEKSEGERY